MEKVTTIVICPEDKFVISTPGFHKDFFLIHTSIHIRDKYISLTKPIFSIYNYVTFVHFNPINNTIK